MRNSAVFDHHVFVSSQTLPPAEEVSGSFTFKSRKTTAKKCTKKVSCTCKIAFLLISPVVVFHRSPALSSSLSITRFYIFFEQTINIISFAFIPNLYIIFNHYISNSWCICREYFIESAGVRYLRTRCSCIRNLTRSRRSLVRFLIQKQRVRKYRTKHFPCGIVFIIYILRHSSFWRLFYFKSFKNA